MVSLGKIDFGPQIPAAPAHALHRDWPRTCVLCDHVRQIVTGQGGVALLGVPLSVGLLHANVHLKSCMQEFAASEIFTLRIVVNWEHLESRRDSEIHDGSLV